jgi:hypothetical protein
MKRTRKRAQGGFVGLPSRRRTFAGHRHAEERASIYSRELTYLHTVTLYAMR